MVVTTRSFEQIALAEPERQWELHHGQLREKPSLSSNHNWLMVELAVQLRLQLDPRQYQVRANAGHLHRPTATYYIPDVVALPAGMVRPFWNQPGILEVYSDPLPLVIEIRSQSTGGYDVDDKLPDYQARGDREIWRMHPYERTLRIWRRQADGSYAMTEHRGGTIQLAGLPGVIIDLDPLFVRAFPGDDPLQPG